jgi:hypothetical protein
MLDMVIENTIDRSLEGLGGGEAAHGQLFILDVAPEWLTKTNLTQGQGATSANRWGVSS